MSKGKAILIKDFSPKSEKDFQKTVKGVPRFDEIFTKHKNLATKATIDKMEIKVYKLNPKLYVDNVIGFASYVLIASIFISRIFDNRGNMAKFQESSAYKCDSNGKILNNEEIYITHRNTDHEDVLNDMGREWYDLIILKPKTAEHFGDILAGL